MTVRLCYASQRNRLHPDLLEDLQDILSIARDFNQLNQIYGVLYYADNAFFQCLEGEQEIVENLFERIKKDARHEDIIHLGTQVIDKIYFKKWSMKYVQQNSTVNHFFKTIGHDVFRPNYLTHENLNHFLHELVTAEQVKIRTRKKVGLTNRGISPFL
ncbi:BLUF domain-containing protein [Acinetobacter guerrae]|uniref:BLUF domain-containing protein n=1 Tax=Acinetobacter guerrae TaxID=1843371 RepID=A0A3A8EMN4_9GAMM|nr:BLUF domain-containing protein [Acinetobacter guerrae]RKG35865.1 BLUF domain-containing protein [Acinetobacter guerrae]